MYKIKQKAHELTRGGLEPHATFALAKQELESQIRLRAYSIYCATKDYQYDDWQQARDECEQSLDFNQKVNERANWLVKASGSWLDPHKAPDLAKTELIALKAFLIWNSRNKMECDWHSSERCLMNEIDKMTEGILKIEPDLSREEAWFCARDKLYWNILENAKNRQKWVSEKAYHLSLENSDRSCYTNWCIAAREYDSASRHQWISERAYDLAQKNPANSPYTNWCLASCDYDFGKVTG